MGELVDGDDGLPAEDVGVWAKTKHDYLCRYVDITRGVRKKFVGPSNSGATYIDLFCGPGRARVRETSEFIDGGCVAAWKESVKTGVPFSKMFIGDLDQERLDYAVERLRALNAPVTPFHGRAVETVAQIYKRLDPYGLHFAFVDPFNLGALDFAILQQLSRLKRIDILIHVNQMDLQRNAELYMKGDDSAFDLFAPGWRENVSQVQSVPKIRAQILLYWRKLVKNTGVFPSADMRLIRAGKNQPLYWLLMAAKHPLANDLWSIASNPQGQFELF